ncbi:GSCOCG00001509001-RA-CDS [Cotesia congregata]|nr:GSCOCG00001509001-RA-CDS [Cotesia congregata]
MPIVYKIWLVLSYIIHQRSDHLGRCTLQQVLKIINNNYSNNNHYQYLSYSNFTQSSTFNLTSIIQTSFFFFFFLNMISYNCYSLLQSLVQISVFKLCPCIFYKLYRSSFYLIFVFMFLHTILYVDYV